MSISRVAYARILGLGNTSLDLQALEFPEDPGAEAARRDVVEIVQGVIERGTIYLKKRLNIVLVEPEIPPNTGNVARLCAATGATLHLVKPLGFSIDDKQLKRAGLDYWHLLDIVIYENFSEFEQKNPVGPRYLATTKGGRSYTDISYEFGGYLLFGKETKGLAPEIISRYPETALRLPMRADARSLNLSNSVAVVVYEVLRQWGFPDLV